MRARSANAMHAAWFPELASNQAKLEAHIGLSRSGGIRPTIHAHPAAGVNLRRQLVKQWRNSSSVQAKGYPHKLSS
jgi:hypothetical protein